MSAGDLVVVRRDDLALLLAGFDDPSLTALGSRPIARLRARVVGGTDGPDQGDPAAWSPYLWAWRISHLTWSGTVDEETATSMAAEYGQAPVALVRAPGAVAAAPPGDEGRELTRGLLKSAWRESEGWRGQAERLARLLVRDRVALARVKAQRDASDRSVKSLAVAPPAGHEDEAAAPPGDEETPCGPCRRGQHGVCDGPNPYWPDCTCSHGIPPASPAGHEDEAAVERAARALSVGLVDDWEDIDWDTQEAYREDARAALAAARGPRTPDPGADA